MKHSFVTPCERQLDVTVAFFPEYVPLYVVNEEDREVTIFYLRPGM